MNDPLVRGPVNWWIAVVGLAAIGLTLGMVSMQAWSQFSAPESPAAPSPEPTGPPAVAQVPVTIDVDSVSVPHPFGLNRCYAPWRIEPRDDAPVTVAVQPTVDDATVSATITFTNTTDQRQTFLAHDLGLVLVDNGRVISTLGWDPQPLAPVDLDPGESVTVDSPLRFTRASLCSHAERYENLAAEFEGQLGEAEIAEFNRRLNELDRLPRDLPAGEYTVYAWTPMVWGEQAAAAQAWLDAGVEDVTQMRTLEPTNPLLRLTRLGQYCSVPDADSPFVDVAFVCATVPPEVWEEVLTRMIPEDSIDTRPSLVAVSQPVTVTID